MSGPPQIFDRSQLRRRKARAAARMRGAGFLLEQVAADLAGRLSLIQRDFPIALDLGAHGTLLGDALLRTGKVGRLLRAPPVVELGGGPEGLTFVCDEELLPLAPQALDLVVSGLGLQFVNDLPGVLRQIRASLRPNGLLLAAMLSGRTLEELRSAFAAAEVAITGGLSPRVAPLADVRDLGQLLQRAGFALPVADSDVLTVTYADPFALMADLRAMGASNVLTDRRRVPLRRDVLAAAADVYRRKFGRDDGRIAATFEVVTLTGWTPHESQQKPLRPGSAQTSLERAVGSLGKRIAEGGSG